MRGQTSVLLRLQFIVVQFVLLVASYGGHPEILFHHLNNSVRHSLVNFLRHHSGSQGRMAFRVQRLLVLILNVFRLQFLSKLFNLTLTSPI